MKIVDLKKHVDGRFAELTDSVDGRFAQVDGRFAQVDARFAQVDARFDAVDTRFDSLEKNIATEHETTRRHMDMLFEKFKAENRLALDKIMATDQQLVSLKASNVVEHATFVEVLHDHEVRIKALEPGNESPETPPSST